MEKRQQRREGTEATLVTIDKSVLERVRVAAGDNGGGTPDDPIKKGSAGASN